MKAVLPLEMLFGETCITEELYPLLYDRFTPEDIKKANRNHTSNAADPALNYVAATYLTAITITSIVLNLYLIYYHIRKKPSFAKNLFISLEITDFLVNTWFPIDCIIALLHPELHPAYYTTNSIEVQIMSFLHNCLINISGCLSSSLAYSRYRAIVKPFHKLRKQILYFCIAIYGIAICLYCFYLTWNFLPSSAQDYLYRYKFSRRVFAVVIHKKWSTLSTSSINVLRLALTSIGIIPGITFSCLTIRYLIKRGNINSESERKSRRGALVIGAMNFMSIFFIIATTFQIIYVFRDPYITFISSVITPTTLSAFNPTVSFLSVIIKR